eukprot:CAMPEP_0205998480 /NCGR_PEP_ID=MMETSP1464-20131121/274_1 /ASSEMBLY_ACC=CAM_ASM_001124 /TAXON_ID=119497 /ORGANISM="Exanthemachrysis gayraliae, Strain RCC1523" /LENGTH=455 /DNA_ID=CAMNT_0053371629 /DNA_START=389 /DNA_END=1752 /DNA_ORIENTATION=-
MPLALCHSARAWPLQALHHRHGHLPQDRDGLLGRGLRRVLGVEGALELGEGAEGAAAPEGRRGPFFGRLCRRLAADGAIDMRDILVDHNLVQGRRVRRGAAAHGALRDAQVLVVGDVQALEGVRGGLEVARLHVGKVGRQHRAPEARAGGDQRLAADPRVGCELREGAAARRVDHEHAVEEVHGLGRQWARAARVRPERSRGGLAVRLDAQNVLEAPVAHAAGHVEWEEVGKDREEADTRGPHVHRRARVGRRLVRDELGRRIRLGAAAVVEQPLGAAVLHAEHAREAKVGELDRVVLVEEHVLQLDVAVRHAARVAVGDRVEKLCHVRPRDLLRHGAAGDEPVEEVPAGGELHEDHGALLVRQAHGLGEGVERNDVAVASAPAEEERLRLGRWRLAAEHLGGEARPGLLVRGDLHHALRPLAELARAHAEAASVECVVHHGTAGAALNALGPWT